MKILVSVVTRHTLKALSILLLLCANSAQAEDLTPISLQLKWRHQFQFAGYYAAKQQGFYEQAGLDVAILEAVPGIDPVQQVLQGNADFGVGTSELIIERAAGHDVVVLGVIFQHSPLNIITLEKSGIDNLHMLANRKVMIEPNSAELIAYLRCEGLTENSIQLNDHTFNTQDLVSGNVVAMSVYVSDEPFTLQRQGFDYRLFNPRMCAIDFYGDNFFTLGSTLANNPKMVEAFRRATLRGWRYAMEHIEDTISLIYQQYSQRHSIEHLRYEARTMHELMQPHVIEPGYMNAGRWQYMKDTYQSLNLMQQDFEIEDLLYQDPMQSQGLYLRRVVMVGGALLSVTLLILCTIAYFYRQARNSSLRLKTMFEHAPFSMIMLDQEGRIQSWNAYATQTFKWTRDETTGKDIIELIVPKGLQDNIRKIFKRVLEESSVIRSENPNLRKDGEEIICEWINAPFFDQRTRSTHVICMARDITERRKLEKELERAAHYDSLTKLPNRTLILDLLGKAIATAKRMKTKLAVLFLDINDFKTINDRYGHAVGDEVLVMLAARLLTTVRASDYVGRLAGDEILIVLQNVESMHQVDVVLDKITKVIAEPVHTDKHLIHVTASTGVSMYPDDAEELDHLITKADDHMYRVKAAFKGNATR